MEDNLETLMAMGFADAELNRTALTKAGNDINEAINFLMNPTYPTDDVIISNDPAPTTTFIGPLTKEQVEQQQQQQQHMVRFTLRRERECVSHFDAHRIALQVSSNNNANILADDLAMTNSNAFTTNAFLDLETKVYGDNWSIPYKRT